MDILLVATELAPYAKVGDLADYVASFSKTLHQLGHKVTIALPRLPHFEQAGLMLARRLSTLSFNLGSQAFEATVYDGRLPSGVDIVLLDLPAMFDRKGIYGDLQGEYLDNALRFAAFSRAVVQFAIHRASQGAAFQIIHLNNWSTALAALYAKNIGRQDLEESTKFVLTLHNLAHQGITDASMLDALGIGPELFNPEGVEFYGKINILKAGILFADAVTTVSETYAREILTEPEGRGLEGVLTHHQSKLFGIINGVDYSIWNPATDQHIPSRFDPHNMTGKRLCKAELLRETGLYMRNERPLLAFVGRLIEQKGIDVLLDSLRDIMRSDVAVLIAGQGTGEFVKRCEQAATKWSSDVVFLHDPATPLVHRIIAGADILLVPSRFEPCCLQQRFAQRYGTVPVVHATGGLIDAVVDCDAQLTTGSGFVYHGSDPGELLAAVQRAVAAYSTAGWGKLVKRVMRLDLSWDRTAHQYLEVYRNVLR